MARTPNPQQVEQLVSANNGWLSFGKPPTDPVKQRVYWEVIETPLKPGTVLTFQQVCVANECGVRMPVGTVTNNTREGRITVEHHPFIEPSKEESDGRAQA